MGGSTVKLLELWVNISKNLEKNGPTCIIQLSISKTNTRCETSAKMFLYELDKVSRFQAPSCCYYLSFI